MQIKQVYKKYSLCLVADEQDREYESMKLDNTPITNANIIVKSVNDIFDITNKPEEYIILICLNTKNYINAIFEVSHGLTSMVTATTASILKRALLVNSEKIIICHNHPSGDATPSKVDYKFTDELYEAANLVGIHLLDHIIIGKNTYQSLLCNKKAVFENDRN